MSETTHHLFTKTATLLGVFSLAVLTVGCTPGFSPNTYSSSAVQQASKVDTGVVIGVRQVSISVDATLASTTGAAAGGIAGSQVADSTVSALGALGGAVLGGIAGNQVGHKLQDTYGYEYIVRKPKGDLVSVTQKDITPLKIGEHVLIIQGVQARIVKDYTEPVGADLTAAADKPQPPNDPKPDLGHKPEPIAPATTEATSTPAEAGETTTATSANTTSTTDTKDTASTTATTPETTTPPATEAKDTTSPTEASTSPAKPTSTTGTSTTQQPSTPAAAKTTTQTTPETTTPVSDTSPDTPPASGSASP